MRPSAKSKRGTPRRARRKCRTPRSIKDLAACPRNPRVISDEALAGLGCSLAEFADIAGIVWNRRTGQLVTGHQRIEALKMKHGNALAISDGAVLTPDGQRFPIRIVDWPADKADAGMLAANNPHVAGDWTSGLAKILADLPHDLGKLFGQLQLDKLLEDVPADETITPGLTDPDDIPEPPDKAVTKPGDLWLLGDHRLLCGDAGNPDDVDRLLDGAHIHLVNTDPPYNVNIAIPSVLSVLFPER